jgi:hypothetical protein
MTEQRTNERRIEQQLDEFRNKWQKEIQQRTVYGHVIRDQEEEERQETINNEEQVEKYLIEISLCKISIFCRRNISFNELVI